MDLDDTVGLLSRHKITSEEYYRAAECGILKPEDRVELIEGEIIDMAPIGPDHEGDVMALNLALVEACGRRALVSPQNSLRLGQWSAPQPDFAVFRHRADFYKRGGRASPADALLVVEVSDTSLSYDRRVKLPLYARLGVGEVWILDRGRRMLAAYRDPAGEAYRTVTTHGPGDTISLALDPAVTVALDLLTA